MNKGIAVLLLAVLAVSVCRAGQEYETPSQESLIAWWQENGEPPVEYVASKFGEADWVCGW